jgi:tetratricopeptide (TPR) repeat protein
VVLSILLSQLAVLTQPASAQDPQVQERVQAGDTHRAAADSAVAEPVDPALVPLRSCLERSDKACAFAAFAALKDPDLQDNPEYLDLAAQVLILKKNGAEALAAINRAIALKPQQAGFYVTQGRIYQQLDDELAAIHSFLQAAELRPRWAVPIYDVGMSFFLLGKNEDDTTYYDRAAQHFKAVLELDPKFHKAEFMLGILDMFGSHLDSAKEHMESALKMSPQNPYYHLHYGVVLSRLADDQGALREMALAEKIDPSYALTYSNLGGLEARMGNYAEARKQLETAVRLDPSLSSAYYSLVQVYHHLGLSEKSDEAFRHFREAKTREQQDRGDPVDPGVTSSDLHGKWIDSETTPKQH